MRECLHLNEIRPRKSSESQPWPFSRAKIHTINWQQENEREWEEESLRCWLPTDVRCFKYRIHRHCNGSRDVNLVIFKIERSSHAFRIKSHRFNVLGPLTFALHLSHKSVTSSIFLFFTSITKNVSMVFFLDVRFYRFTIFKLKITNSIGILSPGTKLKSNLYVNYMTNKIPKHRELNMYASSRRLQWKWSARTQNPCNQLLPQCFV